MNWSKAILAGVVAGIVKTLADYVMHGVIMADTYAKYPVFTQEQSGVHYFFLVGISIAIFAAILFGKTRDSWAEGVMGGVSFGFFLGLVFFFYPFYSPLVLEGFPYHLAWCHGGIELIGFTIAGGVLGLIMKRDG